MKITESCPKCKSNEVVKIDNWSVQQFSHIKIGIISVAEVAHYVCCECGYIESWVESSHELKKIKEKYGSKS